MSELLLHPITITFFVVAIGLLLGKIKICNVCLDLSMVLIIAAITGYCACQAKKLAVLTINEESINTYMSMFSSLGTALFVSSIGLTTGYSLKSSSKGKISSMLIGSIMSFSAFAVAWCLSKINLPISRSCLLGVLSGALTTTPGLSALCENQDIISEEASLGYGCAYLFGVVFTVLAVQAMTAKESTGGAVNLKPSKPSSSRYCGLVQISMVIVLGKLLGGITFSNYNFSLGTSGGILCVGILIGFIIQKCFDRFCVSAEHRNIIRNLGLVLFFVGNGIPTGMQAESNFSLMPFLVGVILTVIPIFIGWIISKAALKKGNLEIATIISGGMTSTPAIGTLASKANIPYDNYSFAYSGALITIVVLFRVC